MPQDPVAKLWCIGSHAVPMATVVDAELEGNEGFVDMLALDLTSRDADCSWAEAALRLRAGTFRRIRWPLFEEIRGLVSTWRLEQARKLKRVKAAGMRPSLVIKLSIRNFELKVRNNPKKINIMCPEEEMASTLRWLLSELRKDLASIDTVYMLAPASEKKTTPTKTRQRSNSPKTPVLPVPGTPLAFGRKNSEEFMVIPEEVNARCAVLNRLHSSPLCRSAHWVPSRNTILVLQDAGNGRKHFAVRGIRKLRRQYWSSDGSSEASEVLAHIRKAYAQVEQHFRAYSHQPERSRSRSGGHPGDSESESS